MDPNPVAWIRIMGQSSCSRVLLAHVFYVRFGNRFWVYVELGQASKRKEKGLVPWPALLCSALLCPARPPALPAACLATMGISSSPDVIRVQEKYGSQLTFHTKTAGYLFIQRSRTRGRADEHQSRAGLGGAGVWSDMSDRLQPHWTLSSTRACNLTGPSPPLELTPTTKTCFLLRAERLEEFSLHLGHRGGAGDVLERRDGHRRSDTHCPGREGGRSGQANHDLQGGRGGAAAAAATTNLLSPSPSSAKHTHHML
ncbi:hypothetical protein AXG93_107s1190 [Marchantia polymorpha subsp. ruderalis]|uniref:Uncharacterized protein n=1 Tax=Marchantia polymorpha subsp. ruderalis TaxID=1480154 RepID=A0A176WKF9_MARPO|nr:hypothetical protein AXG93_107s1190 [Marchantia polymorpha subsp. ruderalis]